MPSSAIDFRVIRPHRGSQHGGFEELTCQLAALDTASGLPFHRKGAGGDAGLECYRVESDGSETGWQAKYFFELGSSEAGQITESFDTAIAKHPALACFIVCVPFDLSDGRVGKRKSERDRWDSWVIERKASIAPRAIEIRLWNAFELTERLSRNDALHVGRRVYWFDVPHFGTNWFKERFAIARAALGRRYTPELNVELPIRKALAAFARDPDVARQITDWADDLDEARHRSLDQMKDTLGATHALDVANLSAQTAKISAAIRAAPLGPTDPLPLSAWRAMVTTATTTLDRCSVAIWEMRNRSRGKAKDEARNAHFFAERLREVFERIGEAIDAPEIGLANVRRLLLTGEAGVGKSHLLADVAEHHIVRGMPAILVLGGAFSDAEPWRQVGDQLGLSNTSPDQFLGALDAAAEAAHTRALVMVDAINERNGIAVWSSRLAAFLAVTDRFRHVALLVSCRTTFVPYIVRDLDAVTLPRIEHPGFAGKAAEAARLYLDQRGIVRMAAPFFAPEFDNPLFLRTCCDMLEHRGERELPRGLAGVSSIFGFYFGAVVERLNHVMALAPRLKRVEAALSKLTEAMVVAGTGYLALDDAQAILEDVHPSNGHAAESLFFQLENEGVITVEPVSDGSTIVEMVRFTFERLSDHRIAQRLLDQHIGTGDPATFFAAGGALARYVMGHDASRFAGIAEALAVQLPERYGAELIDMVEDEHARWNLVHGFQVSLLWRSQSVFTERTLALLEEWADILGGDPVLETLLAIATEPTNRFNANYLNTWLRPLGLPERDLQWSIRATSLADDSEGPINTLIEWVLANGLEKIEAERAHLAAVTLAWLTSLSHRWVRDMATKALATLLVDRRDLAAVLITEFADVDDPYIVDRVLAAAYGAATRRASDEGLPELARAAFAAVFAREPLPVHALVRDHARGIIELAESRGVLPFDVSLERARPPYPRGAPLERIRKKTLRGYVQDYNGNIFHDDICSSALEDGDFARYEIDPLASEFLRLPREEHGRSMPEIYDAWHAKAIANHSDRQVTLAHLIEVAGRLYQARNRFGEDDDRDGQLAAQRAAEEEYEQTIKDFERLLNDEEIEEFHLRAAGYVRGRMWDERAPAWAPTYGGSRSRRWVTWRAHELGWTPDLFAEF